MVDGGGPRDFVRPVPEDYGVRPEDLRIWYSPGRAGAILIVAATLGFALSEAFDGARVAHPWFLGALSGLLSGGFFGLFVGIGGLAVLHWADPLVARNWPAYARLRRYRDALAAAKREAGEG